MRFGQSTALSANRLLDREATRTVTPLQVSEAVHWQARRAGDKLQQARFSLDRPGLDGLRAQKDKKMSSGIVRERLAAKRRERGDSRTSQNHCTTGSVAVKPR